MNRKIQAILGSGVLASSLVLLTLALYLAFVFPKTAQRWVEQGRQLGALEQFVVTLSNLTSTFGLPLLGLLLLLAGSGLIWVVVSLTVGKEAGADQA